MPVILLIILLVLSSVLFYLSGYVYRNDRTFNGIWILGSLIALLAIVGILDIRNQVRSNYMLQVEYDVECKNNECDTTFIYNRKNKLKLTQPIQSQPVNVEAVSSSKPIVPDTIISIKNGVRDTMYLYNGIN